MANLAPFYRIPPQPLERADFLCADCGEEMVRRYEAAQQERGL